MAQEIGVDPNRIAELTGERYFTMFKENMMMSAAIEVLQGQIAELTEQNRQLQAELKRRSTTQDTTDD